ncbi:MAG: VanZ family protein [candidate division Zixibacteria bacterium]|nr:VanZ family protein [candidate division Zixibacteria bacterium]
MKIRHIKSGPLRPFIYYHLPMMLYASAIITVSSIPRLQAPELKFIAVDKLAHFIEYAVFAFLTFRSFANISSNINLTAAYVLSSIFLIIFAALDEFYQSFIPGRYSDIGDVLVDILGALLVVTIFWMRRRRLKEATK